ncbi:MAG: HAMP domain-containing histidine kinase [Clostridia bacterium]|nr:HAMP domain-containing histidine kinase [Clostridia bacterium]
MGNNYWIWNVIVLFIFVFIFVFYQKRQNKRIREITRYIQEINKKNYNLKLQDNREGEISILKNEIYKTTVMLKEVAENSMNDKANLKDALSDISHQLKTPFTSILIILDNLIDNPDMPAETRNDFVRDVKREIVNINFLVNSILILSKFDSNTIEFHREDIKMEDLIQETIKRNSILADLRNVKVEMVRADNNGIEEADNWIIKCDFKWQVEALVNILKDCIEHSFGDSKVIIEYEKNKAYGQIKIRDFGEGIAEEDKAHIFERFYKGKNAKENSIGIGLALAKTIIEKDNGNISVISDETGTEFIVKYF